MNCLRGLRVAMYWMTKVSWSGVLIISMMAKVQEKKGDHISDAIVVASTTVAVGSIWAPELRATMVGAGMATVAAPVAAVAVSVYAIGGLIAFAAADPEDPGWYGAEALKEYYHDPVGTIADIATETIVDPLAEWTQEEIVDPVVDWSLRRVFELNKLKVELEQELFKNRWRNPLGIPSF